MLKFYYNRKGFNSQQLGLTFFEFTESGIAPSLKNKRGLEAVWVCEMLNFCYNRRVFNSPRLGLTFFEFNEGGIAPSLKNKRGLEAVWVCEMLNFYYNRKGLRLISLTPYPEASGPLS
jgi:hypothetical protein